MDILTVCWSTRRAPARACSARKKPPWPTGRRKPSQCAPRGKLKFCGRRHRCSAPAGGWSIQLGTFAPQENEGTISAFLQEHPDFSVIPIGSPYFSPGRPDWIADPAAGLEGTARLWPHHLRGEGHFAAVLQKSGDAPGAARFQRSLGSKPRRRSQNSQARQARPCRRGNLYRSARGCSSHRKNCRCCADCASCAADWSLASCAKAGSTRTRLGALAANGRVDARP